MPNRSLLTLRSGADRGLRPPSFAQLRPDRQPFDLRRPFTHQREAWGQLSERLEESSSTGVFEGVMVMPTGAGKTYTSATWLMKEIINKGGRVVWIVHRDVLLKQAALAFHVAVSLADRRQSVNVRIVSGLHCKVNAIDPVDDVIVVSAGTMARHPEFIGNLLDDPRTFVVIIIDEFHHAVAATYRSMIDRLRGKPMRRLLGLTATPTRTVPHERPQLAELFGNKIIVTPVGDRHPPWTSNRGSGLMTLPRFSSAAGQPRASLTVS